MRRPRPLSGYTTGLPFDIDELPEDLKERVKEFQEEQDKKEQEEAEQYEREDAERNFRRIRLMLDLAAEHPVFKELMQLRQPKSRHERYMEIVVPALIQDGCGDPAELIVNAAAIVEAWIMATPATE